MKTFFSLLCLSVFLLSFAAVGVRAAGSASLSGPSTVRAGDSITVTFYAGGGIKGGNGSLSYDNAVLTLQSTQSLIGGTYAVELSGSHFVFYDNSMENPISGTAAIFSMTFSVNAGVAPGTAFSVKATGVTLSDGNADQSVGTVSYQSTIAPPLSDNADLKTLTVAGANISPAFSPATTNYTASVPFATSKIDISAAADHKNAKVAVSNPALTPGGTTYVKITVTAENGATKTYTIAVARAQDPNYVASNNADLKTLSVEGYSLSPAFDKAVTQYYVWLPYETQTLSLSAETEDAKAAVVIDVPELLPGFGTDIPVTVTAEDGTVKVYTVTAVRAPEYEKTEDYINGEREEPQPTEPTVDPTEAPTEPTEATNATEEPTQPPRIPQAVAQEPTGYTLTALVSTGMVAALMGAAVTLLICSQKKKRQ